MSLKTRPVEVLFADIDTLLADVPSKSDIREIEFVIRRLRGALPDIDIVVMTTQGQNSRDDQSYPRRG